MMRKSVIRFLRSELAGFRASNPAILAHGTIIRTTTADANKGLSSEFVSDKWYCVAYGVRKWSRAGLDRGEMDR
jgi:hypothetical protein